MSKKYEPWTTEELVATYESRQKEIRLLVSTRDEEHEVAIDRELREAVSLGLREVTFLLESPLLSPPDDVHSEVWRWVTAQRLYFLLVRRFPAREGTVFVSEVHEGVRFVFGDLAAL